MHAPGLWLSVASNLAVGLAFAPIGVRLWGRPTTTRGARLAMLAFASWWLVYALSSFVSAWRIGLVALDMTDPSWASALFVLENTTSVLALWGLGAYVGYVAQGSQRGWVAWALALGLLAALYAWIVLDHRIVAVRALTWKTARDFATPIPAWEQAALAAAYFLILVALGIAFWLLARRGDTRLARLRGRAVSWSLAILAIVGFVGVGLQGDSPVGPLAGLLRIAAVVPIWLAYFPPTSLAHAWALPA